MVPNAFTVDVEDYFHVSAFADRIRPEQWDTYPSRVVANTHRLLRILESRQVRATFFVLGWVAERFPHVVRDIDRAGHELANHSYSHRLVYDLTPEEFRDDLRKAGQRISDTVGKPIDAYRAPSFSITSRSLWALDVLIEEGYRYDSSIYPVYHDRYGIPNACRTPYEVKNDVGSLWEFPLSVSRMGNVNVPISGGGYFRAYPLPFTNYLLQRINRRKQAPFVFYIHPWELDPDQPRLPGSPFSRFRHRLNLASTTGKLERLLDRFQFGALSDALAAQHKAPANETD